MTRWMTRLLPLLALVSACSTTGSEVDRTPDRTPETADVRPTSPTSPTPTTVGATSTTSSPPPAQPQPDFDAMTSIRAAFYYPWFPETWHTTDGVAFTNFRPDAGLYDSADAEVLQRHVDEMTFAHIDVGIASWWGDGTATAERFDLLLDASATSALHWSIYYEPESTGDPSAAELVADLAPFVEAHADDPRVFRLDGRPVVFVYADPFDGCDMTERWASTATALGLYVVLKVFNGYTSCSRQPDAWHQYSPALPTDAQPPWSVTVSPGFWKYGEAPRLDRDPNRFLRDVVQMVAAQPRFQLITTFNEWGEGTAVEPAGEWASDSGYGVYLDILHAVPPRP